MTVTPKLFSPLRVGSSYLQHRVVLAPQTRLRADKGHVQSELAVEYYKQRASVPGTLLITEGTFVAPEAGGYGNVPGIWNDKQISAWKRVVDAVHAKGSFIYLQLAACGRGAFPAVLEAEGNYPYVSASDVQLSGMPIPPRPLTVEEIKGYVQQFATAAENAVDGAGFDGVELHGANGYLIDQFVQDVTNKRTDEYGVSVENRARFVLEVVDAVVAKIGVEKTAIRFSPWSNANEMRMDDPVPTFSYIVEQLAKRHTNLAYVHVIEPRVEGTEDCTVKAGESNNFIRQIWHPRPLISAGGYTRELALEAAEKTGDLIAFGRQFISNPDLPLRLKKNLPLTKGNRETYYTPESPVGYIDYGFASENIAELSQ